MNHTYCQQRGLKSEDDKPDSGSYRKSGSYLIYYASRISHLLLIVIHTEHGNQSKCADVFRRCVCVSEQYTHKYRSRLTRR